MDIRIQNGESARSVAEGGKPLLGTSASEKVHRGVVSAHLSSPVSSSCSQHTLGHTAITAATTTATATATATTATTVVSAQASLCSASGGCSVAPVLLLLPRLFFFLVPSLLAVLPASVSHYHLSSSLSHLPWRCRAVFSRLPSSPLQCVSVSRSPARFL